MKRVGSLSLLVAFGGITWLVAPLRFESPDFHQIASLATIGMVLGCLLVASISLPERALVRLTLSLPLGLAAFMYPIALLLSMVAGGPIAGYELITAVQFQNSGVVAYRVNAGANVAFRIRVFHSMRLVPGIALVRTLHDRTHESEIALQMIGPNSVQATIRGGRPYTEYVETYRLRRFVIF